MSLLRSPNGSGKDVKLGGSQPNLLDYDFVTQRNKRKLPDDDDMIRTELSELRRQVSEIMTVLQSMKNDQAENINMLKKDVAAVRDEVGNISHTIESIVTENKYLKDKLTTLTTNTENTEKKLNILEADINHLKLVSPTTSAPASEICEEVIGEIQERNVRAKNIIVVGIPESKASSVDERQEYEKTEILKFLKPIHKDCPRPDKIIRLGRYNPANTRAIKVCFSSEEIVKAILRNRNKTDQGNIKIYSDQTPKQRKHMQTVKEELQKRTASGENNLTIKYIKGLPKIIEKENTPTTDTGNTKN